MWTDEAGITDTQAGIWQGGGGLLSDGRGQIIFASGNGISPAPGPGKKPPGELAESVVRLTVQRNGSLRATDFFSPSNGPHLDTIDGDLGSGGPVGLPFGTKSLPHLMVEGGKFDGLFVLNLKNLGGRDQGPRGKDKIVSNVPNGLRGEWGHPAAFATTPVLTPSNAAKADDYLYYVGNADSMRYLKATLGGANGSTPELKVVAQSTDVFSFSSGSPVVTSDGTNPKTAVVWVVNSSGETGTTGMLQAFPAVPSGSCSASRRCTVAPLWSFPFSGAGKFTIAATDRGRVFIGSRGVQVHGGAAACGSVAVSSGTFCGQVLGFGSPSRAPLGNPSPASVPFGQVAVGSTSAQQQATITNTTSTSVTVESVTTASGGSSNPFAAPGPYMINGTTSCTTAPGPSTCVIPHGGTMSVPDITFTPNGPGVVNGALQFQLDSAAFPNFPAVPVPLSGIGTQPGFYASASSVNFDSVAVGTSDSRQITITNGDADAETLNAPEPGSPFTVAGLPPSSQSIPPGASIPVTVTYQPTTTSGDSGSLTLTGSAGDVVSPATVSLSGQGSPDINPTLTATRSISFGSVPLGQQATRTITISNSGNLPAVITSTSSLQVPYSLPDPVPNGLPVSPGSTYAVHVPVTFTPTSLGKVTSSYLATWTDVTGTHQLAVPLTATGVAPRSGVVALPPPGGGWTFNGSASMTARTLRLNRPAAHQAGSAVYPYPLRSNGLRASFRVHIGGGTRAEGITLSLLSAAKSTPRSIGAAGHGLGYAGLTGVAVTLNTSRDGAGYPSSNFVGVATSANTSTGLLKFAATSTHVPNLRRGSHLINVRVASGTLRVAVDGKPVISAKVTVPKLVLAAFTGASGNGTDHHGITAVDITAGGHSLPPPGGGWSYNGSASTSGANNNLTAAKPSQAGAIVYPVAVPAIGLRVSFEARLGDAPGGDGIAVGLLNPKLTTSNTLGKNGFWLGLGRRSGVPGLGVAFGTASPPGGLTPDFVATTRLANATGLSGFQRFAHGIGSLTGGTSIIRISITKGSAGKPVLRVWLDGVLVLAENERVLTPRVRLAFTAGTSAKLFNWQLVKSVAISAAG
jgi:hypothetical protein